MPAGADRRSPPPSPRGRTSSQQFLSYCSHRLMLAAFIDYAPQATPRHASALHAFELSASTLYVTPSASEGWRSAIGR